MIRNWFSTRLGPRTAARHLPRLEELEDRALLSTVTVNANQVVRTVNAHDLGVNLKPAREMGMTTIKVTSAPQAIAELEAATGLTLR